MFSRFNDSPAQEQNAKRLRRSPQIAQMLTNLAAVLSREVELRAMVNSILDETVNRLETHSARLYLVDEDPLRLDLAGARGPSDLTVQARRSIAMDEKTLTSEAARKQQLVFVRDLASVPWSEAGAELAAGQALFRLKSTPMVSVPLLAQGTLLGVLTYTMKDARSFNQDDLGLIQLVAEVVSAGLNNALMFEREKRSRLKFEAITRAILSISRGFDLHSVLRTIVEEARKVARARYAALGVVSSAEPGKPFDPWVFSGISDEQAAAIGRTPRTVGFLGAVPIEGKSIRSTDITQDPRFQGFPKHHPMMKSFLGVPITYGGRSLGNLYLTEKIGADQFSREDELTMQLFADHAAIAVEHARVHEELTREVKERREAELELEAARAKAQYAAKLTALGEMAAGIAHEVNNPLSAIRSRAQVLKRRAEAGKLSASDAATAAESIDRMVIRIAKIIDSLRAFAREGSQDPFEQTQVRKVIEDTIELCAARFRNHGVDLSVDPVPKELVIECRPVQISQVLLNLLNNAFDAVAELDEKWVRINVTDGEHHVRLRVVDSGTGIPEHIRQRIMQPFFTTKQFGKGTGLGLSISKGIVESHHGRLEATTHDGRTAFELWLPKTPRRPAV